MSMRSKVDSLLTKTLYQWKAKAYFGKCGGGTYCIRPIRIINGRDVSIGNNVSILHFLRLEVYRKNDDRKYIVSIGDGSNIEQNVHITAGVGVSIGRECSVLAGAVITDICHQYDDPNTAPSKQEIRCKAVEIGDQCFIGTHAMIMPGVSLGKHVIVGANSVVTHSFPDYCVVAGVPAKMIKRFDQAANKWVLCE